MSDQKSYDYQVKLKNKNEVAEGTMAFFFEKPTGVTYRAGQHVDMKLIDPPETDDEGTGRTFTLASAPYEPDLMITTRLRDTAFKRILKNMPIGTPVAISAPHGSFTLHNDTSKPAVFLVGGIGVTPAFSIIKDATERQLPHNLALFFSNRRPEDAPYLTELTELAQRNPHFTFVPTMTDVQKSSQPWPGETGYIDQAMLTAHLQDVQTPIYYLSGPEAMVAAMRKLLVEVGANEDNIRTEEFTGY